MPRRTAAHAVPLRYTGVFLFHAVDSADLKSNFQVFPSVAESIFIFFINIIYYIAPTVKYIVGQISFFCA